MEDAGRVDSDLAQQVRASFLAVPGNENALDGIPPSNELIDANLSAPEVKGVLPVDVLQALHQGRFVGGVPLDHQDPGF